MGKFKVEITEKATKDILAIRRSGDIASIKKIESIIADLYEHPGQE